MEDTFNLLGRAIGQLVDVAAVEADRKPAELSAELELSVVTASSVKAALDLDWRLPTARNEAIRELLVQFERLSLWLRGQFSEEKRSSPTPSRSNSRTPWAAAAVSRVRALASLRNLTMLSQGRRETPVQLLGGTTIRLKTVYTCTKARGDAPRQSRGKAGTGVYPVLDELGITDRSTPALRLRVSNA